MTLTLKLTAASICSLMLLTACGGGSGDSSEPDTTVGPAVVPATTADNDSTESEAGTQTDTGTGTDAQNDTDADTQTEPDNGAFVIDTELQLGDAGLCTPEGINAWVDAQMRDYYIYADQVPVVDPTEYEDAIDLLLDLRVAPDIYSSISPQASREALFEAGETFGFGFRWRRDQEGALRFVNIVSGSPLDGVDALRGDRVLALNDIPELDISDTVFNQIFGELGVPTTVKFTIERDGQTMDFEATSGVYVINTVANVQSFEMNGATVGYIESSIFLRTSEAELDAAIMQMVEADPTDIILDFRYNGGGFVFVAQKLAAQLAGTEFTGEVFQNTEFNETYQRFNQSSFLEAQELNLNLPRIIVLSTGSTASASEAIANNLAPYLDVVVIGTETAGKPFASVANPNCEQVLSAMDRITSNNNGETVLGGITPTCLVVDEFFHPMFSPEDALFGAALTYLNTNACPTDAPLASSQIDIRANVIKAPIDAYDDIRIPQGMMIQ